MNVIGKKHVDCYNIITVAYNVSKNGDMIRYLLSRGGDINNENCHIAKISCSEGDIDLVNYLLDLDISNDKLLSMFIASVEKKNYTIADKIINNGLKIEDGFQEILKNLYFHSNLETVKYLIHHGLDINKHGSKLLHRACKQRNHKLIEFYLENNLTTDQKILDNVFKDGDLNIIDTFAKNYINLSTVKYKNTEYDSLIKSSKYNGLVMVSFLKYLLKTTSAINETYARIIELTEK